MASVFDEVIARENTGCAKYDNRKLVFGKEKVIPFWIADMDFKAPGYVIEKLKDRVEHGLFGYPAMPENFFDPIAGWIYKRYGWEIKKEWLCFSPGVVPALVISVLAYSSPEESVVVQPPVYFPFFRTIESQDRVKIDNPLVFDNNRYVMNLEDLESSIRKGVRMIFLCNPHNPCGSVWRKDELEEFAALCLKYHVTIISDEIHSDIIYPGNKHIPIASLDKDIGANTITLMAPSKTFNLAGLSTSFTIIPDEPKRKKFQKLLADFHINHGNVFGLEAIKAAYESGEAWLDQLLEYLKGNLDFIENYLKTNIPLIGMIRPQGTYLAWLDFRKFNMNREELNSFLIHEAGLGLSDGELFGTGGEGFQRLNFGCPRSMIQKGLDQLKSAFNHLNI